MNLNTVVHDFIEPLLQRVKHQVYRIFSILVNSRSGHIAFSVFLRFIVGFVVFRYVLGKSQQTTSEEKQGER